MELIMVIDYLNTMILNSYRDGYSDDMRTALREAVEIVQLYRHNQNGSKGEQKI